MLVGTVLGPFEGLFWVDVGQSLVVLRPGRRGGAAECAIAVPPEQMAQLLEGMMAGASRPVEVPTSVLAPVTEIKPKKQRAPRGSRKGVCQKCHEPLSIPSANTYGRVPRIHQECDKRRTRWVEDMLRKSESA